MKAKTTLISALFVLLGSGCSGVSPEGPERLEAESVTSIEQPSITRTHTLPLLKENLTSDPAWGRLGCASTFECVTNYSESDDDSLDAGLYAKYVNQHAMFTVTPLHWLPPSSWNRAVGVNYVRVVAYMQASGATATKPACVRLSGEVNGGDGPGVFTGKIICFRGPDVARLYSVDLDPPDGVGWTPQNLSNSQILVAALRQFPEGPRVYLAELYVLISYQVR